MHRPNFAPYGFPRPRLLEDELREKQDQHNPRVIQLLARQYGRGAAGHRQKAVLLYDARVLPPVRCPSRQKAGGEGSGKRLWENAKMPEKNLAGGIGEPKRQGAPLGPTVLFRARDMGVGEEA
jgi:hypothetical protein